MLEENSNLAFVSFNTLTFYEKDNIILANKINSKGLIKGKDYFLNLSLNTKTNFNIPYYL